MASGGGGAEDDVEDTKRRLPDVGDLGNICGIFGIFGGEIAGIEALAAVPSKQHLASQSCSSVGL